MAVFDHSFEMESNRLGDFFQNFVFGGAGGDTPG